MSVAYDDLWYYSDDTGGVGLDVTFAVVGVAQQARAGGPVITRDGEVVPQLRAFLYRRPNINVPVAELDDMLQPTFQDRRVDIGKGSLTLPNDSTGLSYVWEHETVVRFEYRGRAAFTMIVNDLDHTAIAAGEEHDQVTTLNGRAHKSVLEEAVVYPAGRRPDGVYVGGKGADRLPFSDVRSFTWATLDFVDTKWTPAYYVAQRGSVPASNEGHWDDNRDFPDPTAWWTWAPGSTAAMAPGGICYFRASFTIPTDMTLHVYATIDNGGNLFFDGAPVIDEMSDFTETYDYTVDCAAGLHTIAVEGVNGSVWEAGATINPAGFLCSVYNVGADEEDAYVVFNTSPGQGWVGVYYPPATPGMTVGEVIRHVIDEAQGRGAIPEVRLGFTDLFDSGGRPWPIAEAATTKTGTNLWTFIGEELATIYCDVWMSPGDFTLWAWRKGTMGINADTAFGGVTNEADPYSGNLSGLNHKQVR